MVWAEIILILIGVAMIGASFYVTEKLSQEDIDHISMMSEAELKKISDKQVADMRVKIEQAIEDIFDVSLEVTQRGLEKETNKKIMAVSEYSETVLEDINKSHNEITFLYSMLNDKQTETAQLVSDLQKLTKQIRDMDLEKTIAKAEEAADNISKVEKNFAPIAATVMTPVVAQAVAPVAKTVAKPVVASTEKKAVTQSAKSVEAQPEKKAEKVEEKAAEKVVVQPTATPVVALTAIPTVELAEPLVVISDATQFGNVSEPTEETPVLSKNEQILLLYKEGKDEVEIAKTLDCGLGEVRLVLGLYNNEA